MEKPSIFQFHNFLIKRSVFDLKQNTQRKELSIGFKPSGRLDFEAGKFELDLNIQISDKLEALKIEVEAVGFFSFKDLDREKLFDFLYINAPAILFPYVRAYISSLTTLSGLQPIVLPTLNLTNLRDELAAHIEEVSLSSN